MKGDLRREFCHAAVALPVMVWLFALMPGASLGQDAIPPILRSAHFVETTDRYFQVEFSEPVTATVMDPFNYLVSRADGGPVNILPISVAPIGSTDSQFEIEVLQPFDPGVEYWVSVHEIEDFAGNITAMSTVRIQGMIVTEPGFPVFCLGGALMGFAYWLRRRSGFILGI